MTVRIVTGDCCVEMRKMKARSVQCCVCSPPYWGLRDYKIPPSIWGGDPKCKHEWRCETTPSANGSTLPMAGDTKNGASATRSPQVSGFCIHCNAWRGCLGLEPTFHLYIEHIVDVFDEVWRVLRNDGTLWLNMGDCYATRPAGWSAQRYKEDGWDHTFRDKPFSTIGLKLNHAKKLRGEFVGADRQGRIENTGARVVAGGGLKPKDLAMMPARVAIALQEAGWWLRQDNLWHKKNPMPESVYDRTTTAHEHLFQFAKSGDTLLWRHIDGRWVYKKPAPDYIWRHRVTREEVREPKTGKAWIRVNLWRGFDYYYDFAAIMEPSSPDSHARAARSRSASHKHSNGPDLSGKPHGIAIGSPVAGRLPVPAGWAEGMEGHHGSVHPNGRRALPAEWKQGGPNSRFHSDKVPVSRKLALHDNPDGPRVKSNISFDAAIGTADIVAMRNKRSVWSIASQPFKEAHFATFPEKLVEPCILAGAPKGGLVLDPFGGAGTVAVVAERLGRNCVIIEINKSYAKMAKRRVARLHMGPEEKKRSTIKASGKLKPAKGLPLFKTKAVTRDSAEENA